MDSVCLVLAGIVNDSIVDGPGIRVTIFAQGCPHHCEGCHNPESHPFGVGTKVPVEELVRVVRGNPLAKGVTFSGGEPFCQAEGFLCLAKQLKPLGYELAAYTGYTWEQLIEGSPAQRALLETLDVLVDGPFILAQRNLDLRFRGSENQRILDVPKSLAANAPVWYDGERWTGAR